MATKKKDNTSADARFVNDMEEFRQANQDGLQFLKDGLSDCETVLLATAGIDLLLKIAITAMFRSATTANQLKKIFSGDGPLSTFDAKIHLSRAFTIFTDESRHDLELIRKIRNEFAHTLSARNFSDDSIKDRCAELKGRDHRSRDISPLAKKQFVECCRTLYKYLISSISFAVVANDLVYRNREALLEPATVLAAQTLTDLGFIRVD